jgi:hypothetical protein
MPNLTVPTLSTVSLSVNSDSDSESQSLWRPELKLHLVENDRPGPKKKHI